MSVTKHNELVRIFWRAIVQRAKGAIREIKNVTFLSERRNVDTTCPVSVRLTWYGKSSAGWNRIVQSTVKFCDENTYVPENKGIVELTVVPPSDSANLTLW